MRAIEKWFLFPTIIILLILIILPFFFVLGTSFTDRNTFDFDRKAIDWVGISNYLSIFKDARFWNSMRVTVQLSVFTVAGQMLLGFFFALLLWKESKGVDIFRGLVLVPMVLPPVVVGLVWRMFLQPNLPGMNYVLGLVGIKGVDWLATSTSAKLAITMAVSWQWMPFVFLLLLAGLQSLPTSCYESARIDGANSIQMFFRITLPLLKRVLIFVLIYRLVETLKIFPIIHTMTGGGPGVSTEPVSYYIWMQAFNSYRTGYASALVVITLSVIVFLAGGLIFYGKKAEVFK
jgi:multiple sugar transport system permease protein